jgi:DNA-binding response OmpR family regulator
MREKEERLDEILLRMGYVTEENIGHALMRQKAHGGRLGSHLLYFKFISEGELVQALSAQYDIQGFRLDEHDISRNAVKQLPLEIAEDYQILPIDYDKKTRTVKIAVADPSDSEMIQKVKLAFGASNVELYVAPESLLRILMTQYYRGAKKDAEFNKIVELPELFKDNNSESHKQKNKQAKPDRTRVLMMTKSLSLKNFLGPVFEKEGVDLEVVLNDDELKQKLESKNCDRLLVSHDSLESFTRWQEKNPQLAASVEVTNFSNVSGAFLENPVPYKRIRRSLFRSLQIIADMRCRAHSWTPPYALICNDIKQLAKSFGFSRVAVDGIQMAAYLLVPEQPQAVSEQHTPSPTQLAFVDFDRSLDIAKSMLFPWDVRSALHAFFDILFEMKRLDDPDLHLDETMIAAQILAIVWYNRVTLRAVEGPAKEVAGTVKSNLRNQAERLAQLEIIETYVRMLERTTDDQPDVYNQMFVVSRTDDISRQFTTRLTRAGFNTLHVKGMDEAKHLCDRHPPVAIIIDHECYPRQIFQASNLFKLDTAVLLYAFARRNDPSLTLDLLDAGFDDVFIPPYDFDVIAARISKSLRGLSRKEEANEDGAFSANFHAFSFIDLIQTLGQSLKTVLIKLSNTKGATATIALDMGRIVYAKCGDVGGEQAVYEVIRWGEEGSFSVEPVEEVPETNVTDANESILMEGCRILDESRI